MTISPTTMMMMLFVATVVIVNLVVIIVLTAVCSTCRGAHYKYREIGSSVSLAQVSYREVKVQEIGFALFPLSAHRIPDYIIEIF